MSKVPGQRRSRNGLAENFDLEEGTACFGEAIVRFAKKIHRDPVTDPLIRQLVRSSTSIGANYCEADDAGSRKEFRHRISLCKRESRETKHWLRMLAAALETMPKQVAEARTLEGSARIAFDLLRDFPEDSDIDGRRRQTAKSLSGATTH